MKQHLTILGALYVVLGLVGGIGLVPLPPWSRVVGLALSVMSVFLFPFGTTLGAYGLWVSLSNQTESRLRCGP